MPPMEWNALRKKWIKECVVCNTEFMVDGDKWEDGYVNMRKHFTTHYTGASDQLQTMCHECNGNKANGRIAKFSKKELYKQQEEKCSICTKKTDIDHLRIDHDHQTGKVRGLLCNRCNTMMHGVDDPMWLDLALKYKAGS